MASGAIRGITVEIGGDTTKLGKALGDSEKKTRSLQTELKQVENALKFNPDNVELLAQKQALLTESIAETSKSLEILEEAQEQITEQFERGEIGADQYRAFQREIITTRSKLGNLEEKLKTTNAAMDKSGTEASETKTAFAKLTEEIESQETELTELKEEYTNVVLEQGKNSEEAKALAEEMTALNKELKTNKSRLDKAESAADNLSDALDDAGDSAGDADGGFTIMKGALADLTANAIQTCVSAIGDFIGALLDLDEATEEYRSMQGKLKGASESAGYSVNFASAKYKEFYKYLGDDQASTNAITNLMGLGTSTESVSKLAEGAIGVWASYGDSIPIEGLTEAINETVQVGKVTGNMADTINWSANAEENLRNALSGNTKAQKAFNKAIKRGESVEDAFNAALSKTTSEQERADIVAQFLNDTYGESKDVYDDMNESILESNEAELKLKDTQSKLGEAVAPVNTALTNLKSQALEAILPVVQKVADGFMSVYNWLQKNPTAMKIVTAVVIALAVALGVLAAALGIQALINGVTKAFSLLNLTMLSNPIVLIVALIAGLVAAFIYLWNNCESFRQFFINAWNSIKRVATTVINKLVEFFTVTVPQAWDSFKTWLPGFIDSIVLWFKSLPEKIWIWLNGVITKAIVWGAQMWSKAKQTGSNFISAVGEFIQQLPGKVGLWLSGVITKVIVWGAQMWSKAKLTATNFVNSVGQFIQQLPGKVGMWLSNVIVKVIVWGAQMWSKAKQVASNFINSVVTTIQGLPDKVWRWLLAVVRKIGEWKSNLISKGKEAATSLINSVVDNIKKLPLKIKRMGGEIVSGLWEGIKGKTKWLTDKISGFCDSAKNAIKRFFGIESPSTVMRDEVGRYIAEGIGVGVEENADNPIKALKNLSDDMAKQDFEFNGATINRKLATTFAVDPSAQINNDAAMLSKLDGIYERLNRLQIVLDTGTLVGETIDKIDAGLATRQLLSARGV